MLKTPKIFMPFKGIYYLTFIVLISSIATSMLMPIFPLYIKSFVSSNALVGYVSAFVGVLLVVYSFLIPKLFIKIKKLTLVKVGFLGLAITQIIFTVLVNIKQFLILEIIRTFFLLSTYLAIGLFVREYSSRSTMGKAEGQYFTISNFGWLIGPLLGGLLATAYSFDIVFIFSAVPQLLLAIILFFIPLKEGPTHDNHKINLFDYLKHKDLLVLYLLSFGLFAWWNIIYTYLPLYANASGFSPNTIGFAMFLSAIPLILLEIPIGKLADGHGFRKYIFTGFIIIAVITLFSNLISPFYKIMLISLATIGAAFIEPLLETYFFKHLRSKEDEHKFYPIYKSSSHLSNIIAPLIYSTILIYFDFKGLFIFVPIFMLFFAFIALKLKR
ncbi:MFS transporter [Candidatus Woesearchaeota archaeon]|nr:MFS transporter [Candidatus Woesearchaeota archaeon]